MQNCMKTWGDTKSVIATFLKWKYEAGNEHISAHLKILLGLEKKKKILLGLNKIKLFFMVYIRQDWTSW